MRAGKTTTCACGPVCQGLGAAGSCRYLPEGEGPLSAPARETTLSDGPSASRRGEPSPANLVERLRIQAGEAGVAQFVYTEKLLHEAADYIASFASTPTVADEARVREAVVETIRNVRMNNGKKIEAVLALYNVRLIADAVLVSLPASTAERINEACASKLYTVEAELERANMELAELRSSPAGEGVVEALRACAGELKDLFAMVQGEVPSLLEDHHQYPTIVSAIEAADAALSRLTQGGDAELGDNQRAPGAR